MITKQKDDDRAGVRQQSRKTRAEHMEDDNQSRGAMAELGKDDRAGRLEQSRGKMTGRSGSGEITA